ncbi:MAG: ABC transporter permease [Lachnospiraceae bacterium]|nr:ABC transporter permease [Lachnospiraceae bacterium]
MAAFTALLKMNIRRRLCDGFVVGYNMIFPIIMIVLLGGLCRNNFYGGITSYQYYTVVMIPFSIVMAMITASYAGKDDAYAKTAERILLTPVSSKAIVIAKVLSCSMAIFLCSIPVYFGAALVTGIETDNTFYVIMLFLTLSFAITALGTVIGLGMKNFLRIKNIMNIPIILFAIMGGTFFRIGSTQQTENILLNLSPLRWINRCLFLLLFDGNVTLLIEVSIVLFALGLVFTMIAIYTFKKGEYMYGNLSGYEK